MMRSERFFYYGLTPIRDVSLKMNSTIDVVQPDYLKLILYTTAFSEGYFFTG